MLIDRAFARHTHDIRTSACLKWLVAGAALALVIGCTDAGPASAPPQQDASPQARLVAIDAAAPSAAVVLLGSSTMARWPTDVPPQGAVRLGLPGDTVSGLTQRIAAYRSPGQASAVVLQIGFNDLRASCDAEAVAVPALVAALVATLPGGTPVVWLGVQDVAPSVAADFCGGRFSALSRSLNDRLTRACASLRACVFVPHPTQAGASEPSPAVLHADDGVHLNREGYRRLSDRTQAALAVVTTGAS